MKYHIKLIESVGIGVGYPTVTVAFSAYAMLPCVTRAQLLPRMADRTRAVKTTLFTSALRRIFSNR